MQIPEPVQERYEAQGVPFKILGYLTERILQFSILKHLENPAVLYTDGVRRSNPREPSRYQRARRSLPGGR